MAKMFAAAAGLLGFFVGMACLATEADGQDGSDLVLQAPDDYCSVNAFYPADGAILEEFRVGLAIEGAMILAMYADCEELHAARTNGRGLAALRHYAVYADYTDRAAAYRGKSRSEILAHLFEASRSATSDNPNFDPALHLDEFALYSGGLFEGEWWTATVGALTVVKGRHISLTLIDIERGEPDLAPVLDRQKTNMERLVTANE